MRVLVTGSRDWPDQDMVFRRLDTLLGMIDLSQDTQFIVVHGACPTGADLHAAEWVWAKRHQPDGQTSHQGIRITIDHEPHPARWNQHTSDCPSGEHMSYSYCKMAGFRRNAEMVDLGADWCLAFQMDRSKGTGHTIRLVRAAGIQTHIETMTSIGGKR